MRVVCPKASRPKSPWRSNVCLAPCERTKSNSAKASITYRKKRTCISRRPARFTRLWPNCRESSNKLHLVCRIGAIALARYGYRRMTVGIDILLSPEGLARFRDQYEGRSYVPAFAGATNSFRAAETGVRIDVITMPRGLRRRRVVRRSPRKSRPPAKTRSAAERRPATSGGDRRPKEPWRPSRSVSPLGAAFEGAPNWSVQRYERWGKSHVRSVESPRNRCRALHSATAMSWNRSC